MPEFDVTFVSEFALSKNNDVSQGTTARREQILSADCFPYL